MASILKLTEQEEKKIASRKSYRASMATLRKLAAGPMIYELDQLHSGDWDQFQIRNIGLTAQRRMAGRFGGDAQRMRQTTARVIERILGIVTTFWNKTELNVLSDFSLTLSMIPDLDRWSPDQKQGVVRIIQAKARGDESRYLRLMQKHQRLRKAILRLGSKVISS